MRNASQLREEIRKCEAKMRKCTFDSARKIHTDKIAYLQGELQLQQTIETHGIGATLREPSTPAPSCHFCGAQFYESPDWEAEVWRCEEDCDQHPEGLRFCTWQCRDAAHGEIPKPLALSPQTVALMAPRPPDHRSLFILALLFILAAFLYRP